MSCRHRYDSVARLMMARTGVTGEAVSRDGKPQGWPDRIDIVSLPDGSMAVSDMWDLKGAEYLQGRKRRVEGWDISCLLSWCQSNGYAVRRWPGGARVFWGEPRPVRSPEEIKAMRAQWNASISEVRRLHQGKLPSAYNYALDFAFDDMPPLPEQRVL